MTRTDYDPLKVELCRHIAGYRTQTAAARQLGCSIKLVNQCERGKFVSYRWLKKMAELYGVSLRDWLYDTSPESIASRQKNL